MLTLEYFKLEILNKSTKKFNCEEFVTMKVISPLDMRICDVNSEYFGISRQLLMENAGASLASICRKKMEENQNIYNEIVIFTGKGGNGGDGLVAARHLSRDYTVHLYFVGDPTKINSKPAKHNWNIISNLTFSIPLSIVNDSSNLPKDFDSPKIIIDCLLGTGVKGTIKEPIKSCINFINREKLNGSFIISADLPSGITADGIITDIAVIPDIVVSFHAEKPGVNSIKTSSIITNIGIPLEAEYTVGPGDIIPIPKREKWDYKGKHGKILIIGGSDLFSGAPALAGKAAYKAGADLVTILTSPTVATSIRAMSPDFIVNEYKNKNFDLESLNIAKNLSDKVDTIIIGPGIGRQEETLIAINNFLKWVLNENKYCVVDADALYAIPTILNDKFLLTPHSGEFHKISSIKLPTGERSLNDRIKFTKSIAKQYNCTILLKGAIDVISNGEKWKINITGTPEMAVGGTGDICSGIAGSFLANTRSTFRSAIASAFINGIAGQNATQSEYGFTTEELIKRINSSIKESWNFVNEEESKIKPIS